MKSTCFLVPACALASFVAGCGSDNEDAKKSSLDGLDPRFQAAIDAMPKVNAGGATDGFFLDED